MDLLQLDVRGQAAKPTELELVHPVTKKPLGLYWKTIGRDADEFQRWIFQRADERNEEQVALKRRNRHASVDQFTAQSLFDDQIEELVFMSRGWRDHDQDGVLFEGDTAISYSHEAAESMLRKYPWMLEQVAAGVGNRALFMPASATN